MAVQGKNAAYQQLKRPEDHISRDILYWNEDAQRKKREERINDDILYQREQDVQKAKQANYDKYVKPLNNYDTKSKSLNEIQGKLLQDAVEQYPSLLSVLNDPKAGNEEKLKAQLKLQNINKLPEHLKEFTDYYTTQFDEYKKAVGEGKVYKNDQFEKAFADGFKNVQLGLDDNGMPVVGFVDNDGDGIADKPSGKLIDYQSYDQIQKGIPTFNFQRKFNFEGAITDMAKKMGMSEDVDQNGFKKLTVKGIDPEELNFATDKLFSNEDVLNSALRDYGLEANDKNLEKIKTDFKKSVIAQTDKLHKEETNFTAIHQAKADARAAAKDNPKVPTTSETVPIDKSTWNSPYFNNIDKDKVNSGNGDGIVLDSPRDFKGQTYNNAKVLNYTFDKYGSLLLDIEYVDTKREVSKQEGDFKDPNPTTVTTTKENNTNRKVIQVGKDDARAFAAKKGMTIDELKKSVQKPKDASKPEKDPLGLF